MTIQITDSVFVSTWGYAGDRARAEADAVGMCVPGESRDFGDGRELLALSGRADAPKYCPPTWDRDGYCVDSGSDDEIQIGDWCGTGD